MLCGEADPIPGTGWGRDGLTGGRRHACFSTTGHGYPPESAGYPRWPSRFASLGVDHLPHRVDLAAHLVVLAELARDLVAGVQHGRMVAAAQLRTDAKQRDVGLLPDQVHRDLPRHDDRAVALGGA